MLDILHTSFGIASLHKVYISLVFIHRYETQLLSVKAYSQKLALSPKEEENNDFRDYKI